MKKIFSYKLLFSILLFMQIFGMDDNKNSFKNLTPKEKKIIDLYEKGKHSLFFKTYAHTYFINTYREKMVVAHEKSARLNPDYFFKFIVSGFIFEFLKKDRDKLSEVPTEETFKSICKLLGDKTDLHGYPNSYHYTSLDAIRLIMLKSEYKVRAFGDDGYKKLMESLDYEIETIIRKACCKTI